MFFFELVIQDMNRLREWLDMLYAMLGGSMANPEIENSEQSETWK